MHATVALAALLFAAQTTPATQRPVTPASAPASVGNSPDAVTAPVYRVGGGITPPTLLYKVEPSFTKEARKRKLSGITTLNLIVDAEGNPQNVHVVGSIADTASKKNRAAALSLDQAAVEAVSHYRFAPAMRGDKPVPVQVNVQVNFQIF